MQGKVVIQKGAARMQQGYQLVSAIAVAALDDARYVLPSGVAPKGLVQVCMYVYMYTHTHIYTYMAYSDILAVYMPKFVYAALVI
jgi:hypothetical protein